MEPPEPATELGTELRDDAARIARAFSRPVCSLTAPVVAARLLVVPQGALAH